MREYVSEHTYWRSICYDMKQFSVSVSNHISSSSSSSWQSSFETKRYCWRQCADDAIGLQHPRHCSYCYSPQSDIQFVQNALATIFQKYRLIFGWGETSQSENTSSWFLTELSICGFLCSFEHTLWPAYSLKIFLLAFVLTWNFFSDQISFIEIEPEAPITR